LEVFNAKENRITSTIAKIRIDLSKIESDDFTIKLRGEGLKARNNSIKGMIIREKTSCAFSLLFEKFTVSKARDTAIK
jgi:hypothetical protein